MIMIRNGLVDQPAIVWDLWHSTCYALWRARQASTWIMERALVEDRYPAVRPTLEVVLNEAGAGGSPDTAPGQLAPIVSWRTPYYGRSYRGRTYLPPPMKDDLEAKFITDDAINNWEEFALAMFLNFCSGAVGETQPQMAIVSRRHNGVPEPVGRFALVTNFYAVRTMGTQTRRLHMDGYYGT